MGLSLRFFTFMHLVFLLSFSHPAIALFRSMQPLCHDDERSALLQFKESLVFNSSFCMDPSAYPKVAKWKAEEENRDCCSWDGITCNEDTGHVIKLDLTSSCLYGSLNSSSSLFRLVQLEWLSLAYNDFNSSKIPSEIINLSMLSHLDISYSYISGQVPSEILELSLLETLDLSGNYKLDLHKPSLKNLAEKLTNLKKLSLDGVDISSSIPHVLANFFSLTQLSLESCELKGEFPVEIFQLPKLYYLNVMYNEDLSGYLPEFDKGSALRVLILSKTRFSGHIPNSIGNLKSLMQWDISWCEFRGIIPSSIGNLTLINYLGLSYNKFSSQVPSSLGNLTHLRYLTLSGIMFPGEIPTFMGNLRSLRELFISYCNLSASQTPPLVLGNLTQLNVLDLSSNNFSSRSPRSLSWISKLTKLTDLYLKDMNLAGEIPSSLKNLTQLTLLNMRFNQLNGPLPYWLINLSQLEFLHLAFNQFTGGIPSRIGNLTQLISLELTSNQLLGSIPNSIFELESLKYLDLSFNNLSGTVELSALLRKPNKTLYELNLSSNKLSVVIKNTLYPSPSHSFFFIGLSSCNLSEFPSFLRSQDSLRGLDLSSNHILGEIPVWLLNISDQLEYLNLSHNLLTGFDQQSAIPLWNTLLTLDLRYNNLQGSLPIPPLSTEHYLISNNSLTGIISSQICDLTHLVALDLSNNKLSGMLPYCLGNFSNDLIILELRNNKFHGSIPQTFMHGTKLKMIDLSSNLLEGTIPRSLASCIRLEFLNLGNNQIIDVFPSWLGTLPELQILMLHSNKFYGVIKEPETCLEFPKLRIINLSHNRFTGELPPKYFQCWNAMKSINTSQLSYMQDELQHQSSFEEINKNSFDHYSYSITLNYKGRGLKFEKISNMVIGILFSNNKFTGEIPVSIANLKGLQNLDLSHNSLFGQIPSFLGNLRALESLDLSDNIFSGHIPQQLGELTTLAYFNVSHNHLTGLIPQGTQFDTFPESSFEGNLGLCGEYVLKCRIVEAPPEEAQGFCKSPFEFDWKIVLIGYAGGLIAGVALGHVFITSKKHEWFLILFQRLLKRMKRKQGQKT